MIRLILMVCFVSVLPFTQAGELPYRMPSAEEQAARKRQLLEWGKRWLVQYGRPFDEPAANYPENVPSPLADGTANTLALFSLGGEREVARAVEAMASLGPRDGQYGIFQGPALMEIWFRYAHLLPADTRAHVLKEIEKISAPGERLWGCCGASTAGGNWGFCSVAGVGLAGEILGDDARLQRAKDGLRLALEQIRTYGTIMEYNSPTYYGPSFNGLIAISSHAKDAEFRGMARAIQAVLLAQTLSLYHPPSEQVSGPWQRCYHLDTYGGPSPIKSLIYPYLPQPPHMDMRHMWEHPAMVGACSQMLSMGGTDAYFPDWLGMFVTNRPDVWGFSMTSHVPRVQDRRGLGTVYHEDDVNVTVYQTRLYTLGSASYVFHNGAHAETPYLAWTLRQPVASLADFKTGFFRMLHHDSLVESDNVSVFGKTTPHVLFNEGRKFAYQHQNRAVLFVHPDRLVPDATRLGLSFYVTELEDKVDEIHLGTEKLAALPAKRKEPVPVVIRDGGFYLAIVPLPGNDDLGRQNAVEIRRTGTRYLQVSFLNYEGKEHSMDEWLYARNGLYLEAADTAEFPTTEDFLAHVRRIRVEEHVEGDVRDVKVTTPEGVMRATYDRREEKFLHRSFDGEPFRPDPFRCPRAALGLEGEVSVGQTSVMCAPPQPVLLAADPERNVYVLLNLGKAETEAVLRLPDGSKLKVPLSPYDERVLLNP